MAKLHDEKKVVDGAVEETLANNSNETSMPSVEDLLKIIQGLQNEMKELKSTKSVEVASVEPVTSTLVSTDDDKTVKLLEALTNKKSDKEVVIVHNREMLGGLSTHLSLQGASIDFHRLGEERVLSWQQFEECVSKYRKFFEKEIILLSSEYADLVEKYDIPCASVSGNIAFNKKKFEELGNMSIEELEKYYNTLTEKDKEFILSYWMGRAYTKDQGFYDRYKMELLNRLSDSDVFDNLITVMNSEFAKK